MVDCLLSVLNVLNKNKLVSGPSRTEALLARQSVYNRGLCNAVKCSSLDAGRSIFICLNQLQLCVQNQAYKAIWWQPAHV